MINTNKTRELIISFNKKVNAEDIPPLCINGNNIDRVTTFKLLGVFVSSALSWDYHRDCVSSTESCKANVLY